MSVKSAEPEKNTIAKAVWNGSFFYRYTTKGGKTKGIFVARLLVFVSFLILKRFRLKKVMTSPVSISPVYAAKNQGVLSKGFKA